MAPVQGQILTLYLNRAPFGGGTLQGVAAASWAYLGKSPQQLTHSEAALLAVLPQAPSRLRPDRHPGRAQVAQDKVLRRLAEFRVARNRQWTRRWKSRCCWRRVWNRAWHRCWRAGSTGPTARR